MRYTWEKDLLTEPKDADKKIGCLNSYCCEAALYYMKFKYDLIVYFSAVLTIIGLLNYSVMVGLIAYVKLYTVRRLQHGSDERIIGYVMAFFVGTTCLYCLMGQN